MTNLSGLRSFGLSSHVAPKSQTLFILAEGPLSRGNRQKMKDCFGPITSIYRSLANGPPHLLRPSLARHKAQIVQADSRRLAPAGQPLQHLGCLLCQPELAANMTLCEVHGYC